MGDLGVMYDVHLRIDPGVLDEGGDLNDGGTAGEGGGELDVQREAAVDGGDGHFVHRTLRIDRTGSGIELNEAVQLMETGQGRQGGG